MAAALYSSSFSALFSRSYLSPPRPSLSHSSSLSAPFYSLRFTKPSHKPRFFKTTVAFAASASSSDDFTAGHQNSQSKKSGISNLIQDIEPLDVSIIQKDVPLTTIDAMKRTISGMLGLLPSDQFQVLIEALWEPLSKLLVSSMMTGYTLRNAEYRLCLERNLEIYDNKQKPEDFKSEGEDMQLIRNEFENIPRQQSLPMSEKKSDSKFDIPDFGKMSPEAQQYIWSLQTRLASIKKELREVKRKSAALQMQQFVGEEKNDLLDYLRSLQPEKVAELSEPTSLEVKEAIHSVVHGLLATLSPRMHSKAPDLADNTSAGTVNIGAEDCIDLIENTSLQFQPMISLTRDYLARLLFWCMLLGHYIRGLEYRLELMELLSLPNGIQKDGSSIDQVD
ncbi:uncharacterized protein LOC116033587 [Ipomoea triloba]|uniref:uncharacterized protein LOC116033587 n=1 Tax=Ipomoea triloba TaxID=35885 RepID=UPI00125E8904|nr:uncharacterized protein LOC116033587 [Ipomoea triloba]